MTKERILELIERGYDETIKGGKSKFNKLFSTSNSKLWKNKIVTFNLEAVATCPYAGECKAFCYAQKFHFKINAKKYQSVLEFTKNEGFVSTASDSVEALSKIDLFRIHSSGDFYNKTYILKWFDVMRLHPNKLFYAYTKSVVLFKGLDLPANFLLIQSEGTTNDEKFIDRSKTFARVFHTREEYDKAVASGEYYGAHKSDLEAIRAVIDNKNVALLMH